MAIFTGPQQDLRVTVVQSDIYWHQPQKNRDAFANRIANLKDQTDIIILPETFTTGFTNSIDDLLGEAGHTVEWMLEKAKLLNAAVCGSVAYPVDDSCANRMIFATPDGQIHQYDKTHLFRMAGEHERYNAGDKRVVIEFRGWRILLLVCYDLRFPVFCRNKKDYDFIICVANWPAARRLPWRILSQARAIENLAYIAAVNRVGEDGNGLRYAGDSLVADYKGEFMLDEPENSQFCLTTTLSGQGLSGFRDKFQAWRDADEFKLLDTE